MSIIHVSAFQPFESRRGVDTVLALRFRYDPDVIEVLKDAIRRASRDRGIRNAGGWLAEHRSWFVERQAWPCVRDQLRQAGYTLVGPEAACPGEGRREQSRPGGGLGPAAVAPPRGRSVVEVKGLVKSWYREMAMKFHPDRTLDNGAAMKAINAGYERLQELLGV
jgi:hypothetical protein